MKKRRKRSLSARRLDKIAALRAEIERLQGRFVGQGAGRLTLVRCRFA